MTETARALLKPKEERRLLRGHAWAYRNEFKQLPELPDGAEADVFTSDGRFVGRGFYQSSGGIAIRLLSRRQETLDADFFAARLRSAKTFRELVLPGTEVYRWIHGESDGLPGLVVDRYGRVAVLQTACGFYRDRQDEIAGLLLEAGSLDGVIVDSAGARQRYGVVPDEATINVDGVEVAIQFGASQKTGMFLDQRFNAHSVRRFVSGARVLDGHCYLGLWACHAALGGASQVLAVDTSATALEMARANAALNQVADRCTFQQAEVEEVLTRGDRYDVIMLDPPAFAKTRGQSAKALTRYRNLNAVAMSALDEGGILISSSCSHFLDVSDFLEMLKRAAMAARKKLCLIEMRGAGPDHPVLLSMPETAYLKCAVLRVV